MLLRTLKKSRKSMRCSPNSTSLKSPQNLRSVSHALFVSSSSRSPQLYNAAILSA